MGINPTQSNFKSFTFDGTNSRAYGVYITGEGVFNAPERNVEMVDIPGRNGAFALDKGNFNNIEVTYPAGIFADTEADFAQAVSDLRNLLCSKVGYVRLEDDYNPNEYRLAIYKSGLDVDHDLLIAGEFELVFECKPQRYLKSGETAISVTSGNTITNPTRFDAQPQLQVKGYGGITINGNAITVDNVMLGEIQISNAYTFTQSGNTNTSYVQIVTTDLNNGDDISITGKTVKTTFKYSNASANITSASITATSGCSATCSFTSKSVTVSTTISQTFEKGTSATNTATVSLSYVVSGTTKTGSISYNTNYNGTLTTTHQYTVSSISTGVAPSTVTRVPIIYGDSTKTATGNPLYIDLEIGEAWNEDSGTPLSLNNAVSFPAELPTLVSGANTITYDNTFTSVDIVPRWWQV